MSRAHVNVKHGAARKGHKSAEYRIWCAMRERCNSPKHISFPDYGGRGIKVCERWHSFANFLADMGARPSADHSIERSRADGHYEPGNCRWATTVEQARNKRTSIVLTYQGETLHVLDWAARLDLSINTIRMRLRKSRDPAIVLKPISARAQHPRTTGDHHG